MPKLYLTKRLYRYLIGLLRKKENRSPRYFALTVCVGIVMGLSPIIGQSYLCILTWTICRIFKIRFNLIVACALTFISNPFTTPFMFYTFYLTGQTLLGENMIGFGSFIAQLNACLAQDISFATLWEVTIQLAHGIGKPIILGYIPWAVVGGTLGYFLGYQAVIKWRMRRLKKRLLKKKMNRLVKA